MSYSTEKNICCIYKIYSAAKPDKFYIGSTVKFLSRKSRHLQDLRKNKHGNQYLQNHANKYGIEDLFFEVVERVDDKFKLFEREQHYFDLLKPTFNVGAIAATPSTGVRWTEERKLKQRERLKGKRAGIKFSEEHKNKLSIAFKGQKRSLGRVLSSTTKEKIRQSLINKNNKGYKQTDEQIKKRLANKLRKVVDINTGVVYDSITSAAKSQGMSRDTLHGWLNDTRRNKTSLRFYNDK
jgi:group I intron endonuclease